MKNEKQVNEATMAVVLIYDSTIGYILTNNAAIVVPQACNVPHMIPRTSVGNSSPAIDSDMVTAPAIQANAYM